MKRILTSKAESILQQERDLLARLEVAAARLDAPAEDLDVIARARQQLDNLFLLAVIGEFNSGKSAFINALLGGPYLEEGVTPTTSQVAVIAWGPEQRVVQIEPYLQRLELPVEWLKDINIVDTPGVNVVIQQHEELTQAFVPRADLVLFVASADRPFSKSEREFLTFVRDWGKKIIFIINKLDILADEDAVARVTAYVREQAQVLLGVTPEIFPISVKWAQEAKFNPNRPGASSLLEASRFAPLETYILQRLDEKERLRLKLESPLGVAQRLGEQYQDEVRKRLALLEEDLKTIEHIDEQLDAYQADMRHDFEFRLNRVYNILLEMRARGDAFFEETIRLGRFLDLMNASRLKAAFEEQVIADTPYRIEQEVNELVDWLVDRNYRQWQAITGYLNHRAQEHGDRIVGQVGGEFDLNRQRLLTSVGRAAREALASYDKAAEARKLTQSVQTSLAAMGMVQVGALGLGAILVHIFTRALDPLGVIAAGGVAIAGLFILPARRRAAKRDLETKIEEMRRDLHAALSKQFEEELARSVQEIREAIAPYTRFVRTEQAKLTGVQKELAGIKSGVFEQREAIGRM
jgi:GTP-binding protein EngB required for normal cell division